MNPMYYILIGVIVLVVAIDFYVKNKNKKSDSTDIDFPLKKEKSNNVLIISIGSLLVVLLVGFFVADKFYYDSRLTNNDDQFSISDIVLFPKYSSKEIPLSSIKFSTIKKGIYLDENGFYNGKVVNGKKDGVWSEFYSNGNIKSRGNFINGKKEGKFQYWFASGQIEREFFYLDDKIDGIDKAWFRNGQLAFEKSYENGKRHGMSQGWNAEGKKAYIDYYFRDALNNTSKIFNDNGMLERSREYSYGVELSEKHFDINGRIKYELFYEKKYFVKDEDYFESIDILGYCGFCSNKKEEFYYENGQKYTSNHFVSNSNEIDYSVWYENDKVIQKQFYRNGKEYGRRIFY